MNQATPYLAFASRFVKDFLEFVKARPEVDLGSFQFATPEKTYPLDKARNNELINNRSGDRIFVTRASGIAYVRANKVSGTKYELRIGPMSLPFQKLFLSNSAQAGKSVSMIIGYQPFVDFASAYQIMKLTNVGDQQINPATLEGIEALQLAICGEAPAADLLSLVTAIEKLPEKSEIQASLFDQKTAVTVLDTITLLLGANINRKGFYIRNTGDEVIHTGNSQVAVANGFPLYPRDVLTEEELPTTAAIYGRVDPGKTSYVRVVEET